MNAITDMPRLTPGETFLSLDKGRKIVRLCVEIAVNLNEEHDEQETIEIMRRAVRGAFPNNRKFVVMAAIADEPKDHKTCDWKPIYGDET